VIGPKIADAFPDKLPELIVEPGTPLVSNAMGVLSSVAGFKEVQGKTFVTMDCSKFNLGAIAGVKNVPIEVFGNSEGLDLVDADLVGFTCIEDDVVNRSYTGKLAVGDKILFKNVGAYSNTFAPHFIMPVIGMVTSDGKVIKERDDFDVPFLSYVW
jgi:diaminopimelate decarboxylase